MVIILLALLVLAAPELTEIAWSAPITLNVNPAYLGNPPTEGFFVFSADGLTGTRLNGQALTLDLVFADGLVGRALGAPGHPGGDLVTYLVLETNALSDPGRVGADGAGGLRLTNGSLVPGAPFAGASGFTQEPGRPDAWDSIVYFQVPTDASPTFNGLHYELTLPSTGYDVTGAYLQLAMFGRPAFFGDWYGLQFGTPEQVPEPATLTLLGLGLAGVGVQAWRRRVS